MTDPLHVNELEDVELRDQFNDLFEAMEGITTFDPNREEGAYDALNQRIHDEVTDKPILSRIVKGSNQSLLYAACVYLNLDTSHQAIKLLIESNPSTLLVPTDGYTMDQPIYMISRHPEHCVLLPWIAFNYARVLDHERCPPVVLGLLEMYAQRHRTRCTATTLKTFLEAYPRAFTQQHPTFGTIIHACLPFGNGHEECEVDLFKWMAERCPSSYLLETDSRGSTPLHLACNLLRRYKGRNSVEICKYLIRKCPGSVSVRLFDDGGEEVLPIHYIQGHCNYRVVREVVVCLLREYPESYDMQAYGGSPSSIPFIQTIKPNLHEEKELKETIASLEDSASSFTDALTCTNDKQITSVCTVFDSWATSFINSTEDKLQQISTQLQDLCNEGRESNE